MVQWLGFGNCRAQGQSLVQGTNPTSCLVWQKQTNKPTQYPPKPRNSPVINAGYPPHRGDGASFAPLLSCAEISPRWGQFSASRHVLSERAVLPPGAITKNGLFLFFKSLRKQNIFYGKKFTVQK